MVQNLVSNKLVPGFELMAPKPAEDTRHQPAKDTRLKKSYNALASAKDMWLKKRQYCIDFGHQLALPKGMCLKRALMN